MKRGYCIGVLTLVLIAALYYAWAAYPRQVEGTAQPQAKQGQYRPGVIKPGMDLPLLELPDQPNDDFLPPHKNPFGPLFPNPVVVKKVKPVIVKQPVAPQLPPPPPPVIVEELVSEPVFVPLPDFKVLGQLERAGMVTVFLEGGNGELFVAKEGQELPMGMRITKINGKQVELTEITSGRTMQLAMPKLEAQHLPRSDYTSGRVAYQQGQDREIIPETNVKRGKDE